MPRLKKLSFLLLTSFFVIILYWTYSYYITKKFSSSRILKQELISETKFVLYWTPFWNQKDYFYGYGFEPFKDCDYKNCYATDNRTFVPLQEFDALIFHALYNKERHGVPWTRTPNQRYIFMNVEAPIYICPDLKHYSSFFNWTMTYRFDSDIVRRHGYVIKGKTNYTAPSMEFLGNKTKLVAWFVSNCRTSSRRENLTRELRKFIPVDIFGACGKLRCHKKANNGKVSSGECYNMVEQQYKFYLAFENSYCKDYSTEKLYNLLEKDVIPVVYGAGDYELSAPPNSVINVEDFENVEDLAVFLQYLNENLEAYLKYFEWKKEFKVTTSPLPSACQICEKLHEPFKRTIYEDLDEWWWGKDKSVCKKNKDLPKIVRDIL